MMMSEGKFYQAVAVVGRRSSVVGLRSSATRSVVSPEERLRSGDNRHW
jgi:hypothetical protein